MLKKILVGLSIFIFGMALSPKGSTKVVYKTDPAREKTWVQLKQVDDEAINLAAQGLGYCRDFSKAVSNLDADAMINAGKSSDLLVPEIESISIQRTVLLNSLGY